MADKQILALGFFDGVHVGHGALLQACHALANRLGCRASAVTFSAHPGELVSGKAPALLNTLEQRVDLMKTLYHMDEVVVLPFDKAMMTMPWRDFLNMLMEHYSAAGFVCGRDFRFGNRGEGTAVLLEEFCRSAGLGCVVVPEQYVDGVVLSSSHIRKLLQQGDMAAAVRFLGHPHLISGTVVPGRQLGRTIGIPTANLTLPEGLLCPQFGVYACVAEVNGQRFPAVTNIGIRPTVGGSRVTVEPWLLGECGDLYGKEIDLHLYEYLRPEKKFDSLEKLKQEIQKNAQQTLNIFRNI